MNTTARLILEASCGQHGDVGVRLAEAWSAMATENERLRNEARVPGVMQCDKCNFSVTRVSLNIAVGTVTAGSSAPEDCPNGCGVMRPATWREDAIKYQNEHMREWAAAQAYKWGYEYLQGRMLSIGRGGWAADCDDEIRDRIKRGGA